MVENMIDRMSDKVLECLLKNKIPKKKNKMPENIPKYMSGNILNKMSENIINKIPKHI